jgi:hypothetical protein
MSCRHHNKRESRTPYQKANTSNSPLVKHGILTHRKLIRVKDAPYFLTTRSSRCAIFTYGIRREVEIFLAKVATAWCFSLHAIFVTATHLHSCYVGFI